MNESLLKLSMKRRRHESLRLRIIMCLSVLLLSFTLLFQDNMSKVRMELNFKSCGKWFAFDNDGFFSDSAYLTDGGSVFSGPNIYLTENKNEASDAVFSDGSVFIVNELFEGRNTLLLLGAFSDGFAEKNGIEPYEGRLPERAGEIAVELNVLRSLGLSYDLGQQVEFLIAESSDAPEITESDCYTTLRKYSFTLVGTLPRYTSLWSDGAFVLPNAVITPDEFNSIDTNKTTYNFYDLKDEYYSDPSLKSTAFIMRSLEKKTDSFIQDTGAEESIHSINRNTYLNPLWGDTKVYTVVTLLITVMSAAVSAYLMAVYLSRRRSFFLRMREIGASTWEVFRFAAYEGALSLIPSAAVTLVASYALSIPVMLAVCAVLNIGFTYVFTVKTLMLILALSSLVLVLSLFAALLVFAGRGLLEKKKPMSAACMKRLRRRKAKLGLRESLAREKIINGTRTFLMRIFTVITASLILISSMNVYREAKKYVKAKFFEPDFVCGYIGSNTEEPSIILTCEAGIKPRSDASGSRIIDKKLFTFTNEACRLNDLLTESELERIKDIPGVSDITLSTVSSIAFLDWNGKEDDPYYNAVLDKKAEQFMNRNSFYGIEPERTDMNRLKECIDLDGYMLYCYDDIDYIWNQAEPYLDKSVADKAAFIRGEQVILLIDEALYFADERSSFTDPNFMSVASHYESSENVYEKLGSFLKAGAVVTARNSINGEGASAVVSGAAPSAYVVPNTEFVSSGTLNEVQKAVSVVGSTEYLKRLMKAEGHIFGANYFRIKLDALAKTENTAKNVSRLLAQMGVMYVDYTEYQTELQKKLFESVFTYGLFAAVLTVLFLFVMKSIKHDEHIKREDRIKALLNIGAERSVIQRELNFDALKESLLVFIAVPAYSAVYLSQALIKRYSSVEDPWGAIKTFFKASGVFNGLDALGLCIMEAAVFTAFISLAVWLTGNNKLKGEDRHE